MSTESETRKISRRSYLKYAAAGVAVAAAAAGAGLYYYSTLPAPSKGALKVGVAAPLSGYAASVGTDVVRGVTMALEEVSYKAAGYDIQLITGDTEDMEVSKVYSVFERLITLDKVDVILAGYASENSAEIDFVNRYPLLYIHSGSPNVDEEKIGAAPEKYPYVWCYTPQYWGYGTAPMDFMNWLSDNGYVKLSDPPTFARIACDTPYSRWCADRWKEEFPKTGWEMVIDELFPLKDITDYSALLAEIHSAKPDLIMNGDITPGNEINLLSQFLKSPTNSHMFIQWGALTTEFREGAGSQGDGVLTDTVGLSNCPKYKPAADWTAKYTERFGAAPTTYSYWLYDEARQWLGCVGKAKNPRDAAEMSEILSSTTWTDQVGYPVTTYEPKTHLAKWDPETTPTPMFQVENKQLVTVWPRTGKFDVHEADYKIPPWFT